MRFEKGDWNQATRQEDELLTHGNKNIILQSQKKYLLWCQRKIISNKLVKMYSNSELSARKEHEKNITRT